MFLGMKFSPVNVNAPESWRQFLWGCLVVPEGQSCGFRPVDFPDGLCSGCTFLECVHGFGGPLRMRSLRFLQEKTACGIRLRMRVRYDIGLRGRTPRLGP